jgi:hypothetical protein
MEEDGKDKKSPVKQHPIAGIMLRIWPAAWENMPVCLVISVNSGYNDAIHQFCGKTNKEQF